MGGRSRQIFQGTSRSESLLSHMIDTPFYMFPQAFEQVVPSERTRVNLKVHDTSIRLFAPAHKGALLSYIGELEFSTVIEGNLPITIMNLSLPSFSLLLLDDVSDSGEEASTPRRSTPSGAAFWKVGRCSL